MDLPKDDPKTAEEFVALLKFLIENEPNCNAHALARIYKANLVYGLTYEMPDGSRFQTNREGNWARLIRRQVVSESRFKKPRTERQLVKDFLRNPASAPDLDDI